MRDIAFILGKELQGERRRGVLEVIGQHRVRGSGANLMWSAELAFHHGCLRGDRDRMTKAIQRIWQEIDVGRKAGIQDDGSFFQHGLRLQMYHYGRSYLDVVVRLAWQTRGTPWAIPPKKREIITSFPARWDAVDESGGPYGARHDRSGREPPGQPPSRRSGTVGRPVAGGGSGAPAGPGGLPGPAPGGGGAPGGVSPFPPGRFHRLPSPGGKHLPQDPFPADPAHRIDQP